MKSDQVNNDEASDCPPSTKSNRRCLSDDQLLSFFWDKWKVGNDLAYRRWTSFWATTGVAVGGSVALLSRGFETQNGVLSSILLVCGGLLGVYWKRVIDIDVRVRNAHNPEIVKLLQLAGHLEHIAIETPHDPDDHDQQVNQWHARSGGARLGAKLNYRGTSIVANMMKAVALLQILGGLVVLGLLLWSTEWL